MTPHKHAAIIKAWADGAQVQTRMNGMPESTWSDIDSPAWHSDYFEYRIKPTIITHDLRVTWSSIMNLPVQDSGIQRNLRLTFTDGVLTDAIVIKE
jgi:hypothetical protein